MGRLAGQFALVAGGAGEIGTAICAAFAREGAEVAVADLAASDRESAATSVSNGAGKPLLIATDVTDERACEHAVRRTVDTFGKLTVLVNMAAWASEGTVETISLEDWNKALAVNVTGALLMSKHAIPEMRRAGGGAIVNVASQLGQLGSPGRASYCTSKAALIFLTRMMAMDHAPDRIRANSLSPGAIGTDRLTRKFGGPEETVRLHGSKYLLSRLGTVEEVAEAAVFLASPESSFMTGADLLVDGGYTIFK